MIGVIDPIGTNRGNSIGIVKQEIGDRVVVEQDGRLIVYEVDDDVSVKSGYTVELSNAGRVREVIETTAIQRESRHPASTEIDDYIENLKFPSEELEVGFEHFGRMSEHLRYVQKRVDLLLNQWETIERIGRQPTLGALFYGKPGTGKTHPFGLASMTVLVRAFSLL